MRRIVLIAAALAALPAMAQDQPKRGGTLNFAVNAEPPNYDCHANTSFAFIHPVAPHYSTLLKFDAAKYPEVVADAAESWEVSSDLLTYTFKLRRNIKFHDGTDFTSEDVKATYERLRNPPAGVSSIRKANFEDIGSIETPDAHTVVFKMKAPDPSMLANFASPWNCLYSAAKLRQDAKFPEKNILGTGPFKFGEHVAGSHWTGTKFDGYFIPGKPYLDGYRAVFMSGAAIINAIQGGQVLAEFRGQTPPERDKLVEALKDKVKVQESPWVCMLTVLFNTQKKPFDDIRVRQALNIGIDRWKGSEGLSKIALVREVGGLIRPGYEYAAKADEVTKLPGLSKDIAKARNDAKALLKAAGQEQLKVALLNRNVPMPYTPSGVFLINEWRQLGVQVEHRQLETRLYQNALSSGDYEAAIDFACDFFDEPNIQLVKYISADKSPLNYGRYNDRKLDELYERQKRMVNKTERMAVVREFERHALEQAYQVPMIWWHRIIVHNAQLRGWPITPSHYLNQDLVDVWIAG